MGKVPEWLVEEVGLLSVGGVKHRVWVALMATWEVVVQTATRQRESPAKVCQ